VNNYLALFIIKTRSSLEGNTVYMLVCLRSLFTIDI